MDDREEGESKEGTLRGDSDTGSSVKYNGGWACEVVKERFRAWRRCSFGYL
jgi:hypothetical protein